MPRLKIAFVLAAIVALSLVSWGVYESEQDRAERAPKEDLRGDPS